MEPLRIELHHGALRGRHRIYVAVRADISNEPTATLQGVTAVRAYFAKGLAAYPELLRIPRCADRSEQCDAVLSERQCQACGGNDEP